MKTIAEMQILYRKKWHRSFSVPARTRSVLEDLIIDCGSETVLRTFSLFLNDSSDYSIASFVRRFQVYKEAAVLLAKRQKRKEREQEVARLAELAQSPL